MNKLTQFSSRLEAEMAKNLLISEGIPANISGSREYGSHFTGSEIGLFELYVDSTNFKQAHDILNKVQAQVTSVPITESSRSHLKKSIVFATGAWVVLPIVFNYVSIKHGIDYWKKEPRTFRRFLIFVFLVFAQIPSLFILKVLIEQATKYF